MHFFLSVFFFFIVNPEIVRDVIVNQSESLMCSIIPANYSDFFIIIRNKTSLVRTSIGYWDFFTEKLQWIEFNCLILNKMVNYEVPRNNELIPSMLIRFKTNPRLSLPSSCLWTILAPTKICGLGMRGLTINDQCCVKNINIVRWCSTYVYVLSYLKWPKRPKEQRTKLI